jgi:hypothetical protein
MAGSLKWFIYTDDRSNDWALLADESNIEAVNSGAVQPITPAAQYKVPGNLRTRKAVFQSADGLIRRDIVVLTAAQAITFTSASTIVDQSSGVTLNFKTAIGERLTLPTLSDTGLLDGDAD